MTRVLARLEGHWQRIVRRPLSDEDIIWIQEDVGVAMPTCLREYLHTVGLFQTLSVQGIQVYTSSKDFAEAHHALIEWVGERANGLFPFGHDGAGDIYALQTSAEGEVATQTDAVLFCDHETCVVTVTGRTFTDWLEDVVTATLLEMPTRAPATAMRWKVQFTFSAAAVEQIIAVLRQAEDVTVLSAAWTVGTTSPAGVRSSAQRISLAGRSVELRRLEYAGWPTPLLSFDWEEPVDVPSGASLIRRLDALFRVADLGYVLVDYGPGEATRSDDA